MSQTQAAVSSVPLNTLQQGYIDLHSMKHTISNLCVEDWAGREVSLLRVNTEPDLVEE